MATKQKKTISDYLPTSEQNQRDQQNTKQLLDMYNNLNPVQRWITDIAAVAPKAVDGDVFVANTFRDRKTSRIANSVSRPVKDFGKVIDIFAACTKIEIKSYVQSLIETKILISPRLNSISITERNRVIISRHLFVSGRYNAVREIVCALGFEFPSPDSYFFTVSNNYIYIPYILDAIYQGQFSLFYDLMFRYLHLRFSFADKYEQHEVCQYETISHLLASPVSHVFMGKISPSFCFYYFSIFLEEAARQCIAVSDYFLSLFDDIVFASFKEFDYSQENNELFIYIKYLVSRGDVKRLTDLKTKGGLTGYIVPVLEGIIAFLERDVPRAACAFAIGRTEYKKQTRKRVRMSFFETAEIFHVLAVLGAQDESGYEWIDRLTSEYRTKNEIVWRNLYAVFQKMTKGQLEKVKNFSFERYLELPFFLGWLASIATYYWDRNEEQYSHLLSELARVRKIELPEWFRTEYEGLEAAIQFEKNILSEEQAKPLMEKSVMVKLVEFPDRWDIVRQAISSLFEKNAGAENSMIKQGGRIVWRFSVSEKNQAFYLEPYLQTIRAATGAWTAGKRISVSNLLRSQDYQKYTATSDLLICNVLSNVGYFDYFSDLYSCEESGAVLEYLVDKPLVFDRDYPDRQLEFSLVKPSIEISRKNGESYVVIRPFPSALKENDYSNANNSFLYQISKQDKTHYQIVKFEINHIKIANMLTQQGLLIPKGREEEVGEFLSQLLPEFSVRLDSKTADLVRNIASVEDVPSDSRIHLLLTPNDEDGLTVEMSIFPLGEKFESYSPGYGVDTVLTDLNGRQVCAHRDFTTERRNLKTITESCPALQQAVQNRNSYTFADPLASLDFLSQLESIAKEYRTLEQQQEEKKQKRNVKTQANANNSEFETAADGSIEEKLTESSPLIIKWPHGNRIRVSSTASFGHLSLNFQSVQSWFEASGELNVDQYHLDFAQLLLALNNSSSRFIKMGERDYLALTDQFRKKLADFQYFSNAQGKKIRIHPLAAQAIDESFTPAAGGLASLNVCEEWKQARSRFIKAGDFVAKLPKAFQGELRDYQFEGFQWLARLAEMGTGGCLADDMGLGKTIQSIALLLLRAKEGPALVVAPTSVCANWEREINRFAPSLNVKRISSFAETKLSSKGERKAIIESGKPYDVLLTNYSILTIESETFAQQKFNTIILDEAQAIKNHLADRTQAVMKLQGDFRLITTGTPIENNLGELWSLFEFINPGFLGTKKQFDQKFGLPIQRDGNAEAKRHLRAIVRPFVLRRLKSEVLQELPQKTEVQLEVELSAKESALYETIRQQAMESLKSIPGDQMGKQRIQILAELMRLRRLCCHPNLVVPEAKVPGSKLDLIGNTVADLLENNHKVLLFSQFTDYLKIIESELKSRKIESLYLDGSMTQSKRQKAIDSFQSGIADVFLISLKAGGFGLNLTAADYVIHADPWWNPAVENQASDRAHRIGQKRPVTVYRMITKGTIEEKIMELHQKKDQLAEDIIGGADTPTKISFDDLLQLLR